MFDKDNKFGFIINNNNGNSNNTDIKKYIDDNTIIHPLPVYKKVESPSMIMYMVNIMDLKEYTAYGAVLDMNTTKYQRCRFIYICDDGKNKVICSTGDNLNDTTFRVSHYNTSSALEHGNAIYSVDYTKHNTPTDVVVKITLRNYLGIYNSTEYTPEEDYNPATKKYVDDNKTVYTISSKVLATVSASDIKLNNEITINNVSFNKDRKYYIEFLGSKKLCGLVISENSHAEISCIISNYVIQGITYSSNLMIGVHKMNTNDTTDTFTDLVIYEEEVKYLDNKYLENNLIIQNSISLGRVGDIGTGSSAIGNTVEASGMFSHAEGYGARATGNFSHAEGSFTEASGYTSHAEGDNTIASSENQHVQGKFNIEDTEGKYAHIVGNGEDEDTRSNAHTLDWSGNAWYKGQVEGTNLPYTVSSKKLTTVLASNIKIDEPITINNTSINKDRRYYIEFLGSKKLCSLLISEEQGNCIICNIDGYIIEAFNQSTNISLIIINTNTHDTTIFTDLVIYEEEIKCLDNKYLENNLIIQNSISLGRIGDIGGGSSAIGAGVEASAICSHAEGNLTKALGRASHVEGNLTIASGEISHAEGDGTIASSQYQHVQGKYNIEDTEDKYAHIVGNGTDEDARSNAHTLDWQGNAWYAGKLSQEGTPTEDKDLTTKKYVDDKVSSLPQFSFNETGELVVTINGVSKTFVPKSE